MQSRLYEVIETLLNQKDQSSLEAIACILNAIDFKTNGNRFDDLVDLVQLLDRRQYRFFDELVLFKKELVNAIYNQRGEDGHGLIKRIRKYES